MRKKIYLYITTDYGRLSVKNSIKNCVGAYEDCIDDVNFLNKGFNEERLMLEVVG